MDGGGTRRPRRAPFEPERRDAAPAPPPTDSELVIDVDASGEAPAMGDEIEVADDVAEVVEVAPAPQPKRSVPPPVPKKSEPPPLPPKRSTPPPLPRS